MSGWVKLARRQNPESNSDLLRYTSLNVNKLFAARVKSIVLDDTYPDFEKIGGWNALGVIEYDPIISPEGENSSIFSTAYPLNSNFKNYPLVNEIVYIISFPNQDLDNTNASETSYYINNISIWNHPHHNAYPSFANESNPPQQKDYIQTQAGSTKIVTDENKQIFLGKTFKEKANIHPLLPFEGDIIYEGRWGNSIRLGSTVKNTPNNWSSTGEDGDPIFILRNGQGIQSEEGWVPIVENINNSDSSIYLTSTQQIPIKVSSDSYVSYTTPPTSPNKYSGKQIILNSGRLVFNSIDDHILFSSAKSINLNSIESVNVDTKKFVTQADKIFLGKEELANQPLMLGTSTVDLIKNMLTAIKDISDALKNLQSAPVAPYSSATFPSLPVAMSKIQTSIKSLEDQINSGALTSKRNFTL